MRLFVALDLASEHKRLLSSLRRSITGVTWYPPESYHLTLRFIGDVQALHLLEEIDHALAAIRGDKITIQLGEVGLFTHAARSKLWAGVVPSHALTALQARIEAAVRRIGFQPEKRRFHPHVSLGTFRGDPTPDMIRWVQGHNLLKSSDIQTEHFTLFRSYRTSDVPHYESCADYSFATQACSAIAFR
ncbi:RNA 2',3'-cyclic phosphodiesterase [Asaia prunellae]|uniref:RNA 2',3'-cyclic phosphodiesterase n=1 Tax=Asaia prunellae TaxID=610245 RepID=UPI00046EB18F|nr:RNA 2',3'-cyclic phosphodiesterase [Asaia prunellae]